MFQKGKTLVYSILLTLVLVGCSSKPKDFSFPKHPINMQMDIKNGEYESFAIDYWKPEYDMCFDTGISNSYKKNQWGAQVAWLLSDKEGNTFKVYFSNFKNEKFDLILEFVDRHNVRSDYKIIESGLRFGEVYSSKFSFIEPKLLSLDFLESNIKVGLPFIPKYFVIAISGLKAQMGYSSVKCSIS